jgi:hypothetical protein
MRRAYQGGELSDQELDTVSSEDLEERYAALTRLLAAKQPGRTAPSSAPGLSRLSRSRGVKGRRAAGFVFALAEYGEREGE